MLPCPAPDGSLLAPEHRAFLFESLGVMNEGGFRDAFVRSRMGELADRFAGLQPTEDELWAWEAELRAWVRWYRVPGYWLSALFHQGCVRLGSLHSASSGCLFAEAQMAFADDLAQASLETSYVGALRNRAALGSGFERVRQALERMLGHYRDHLAQWARPFDALACNPLADHLCLRRTVSWLADDLAEDRDPPRLGDEGWLRGFIDRVDHDQLVWHQVVGRRFLGLLLASRGDAEGQATQFGAALALALPHRLDTEIGQLQRLLGKSLRDLGRWDEAIAELERAIRFEGAAPAQELATYWQALSTRELGDALLQRAIASPATAAVPGGDGHAALLRAVEAYRVGRLNFGTHLAIQCPQPLARAAKQQMQRPYAANALLAASLAQRPVDLLAEWEESGPREATGAVIAMALPAAPVGGGADRASFRRNRARYFATLNTTPAPLADYLADVVADAGPRRDYLTQYIALAKRLAETQRGDGIAERVLALRLPDTCFLLFHLAATSGNLLLLDLAQGQVATVPLAFGERQVREWHAEHQRDGEGAAGPAGKSEALRRHLARYEQALATVLGPLLPFFAGHHLKVFPRLQMNAVPFHALQLEGRPLLAHCTTVSYGQTLGLFLANHESARAGGPLPRALRLVVGRDVPWYEQILPGVRKLYPSDLDEHTRTTWPELVAAIGARPARDTVFACHGRFDAAQVTRSELDLGSEGPDRQVSFDRVFEQLDLQDCRSVVMGSCESGVSRTEVTAEYLGLPAAMLASGVRTVVGALWTIPQLATAVAMERLIALLRDESASVAVALSQVQREMLGLGQEQVAAWVGERLSGDPELPSLLSEIRARGPRPFEDPYHWAGLQALGDI